jgi:glycosyltransferase involved in cell wall biosynthesis
VVRGLSSRRDASFAASVVIPTRNRRVSVLRALSALSTQTLSRDQYEVIVALDGSSDGTAEALAAFAAPYALRTIASPTRGRAATCNAGARAATGELLVFLDDDMEAAEGLLEAHRREHPPGSHRGVVGAVPVTIEPHAPPVVVYIGEKFNRHLERLARTGYRMTFRDFYSGNFSIARDLFLRVGGFDEDFRIYGNEDGELALRLLDSGVEIRYSAAALARQHYEKDFAALARDNTAKGRTAVLLSRKWPAARPALRFAQRGVGSRRWRAVRDALLVASKVLPFVPRLAVRAMGVVERFRPRRLELYYRLALDFFYLLGARSELARNPSRDARSEPSPDRNDAANRHSLHG